jgi:hypothetical protein
MLAGIPWHETIQKMVAEWPTLQLHSNEIIEEGDEPNEDAEIEVITIPKGAGVVKPAGKAPLITPERKTKIVLRKPPYPVEEAGAAAAAVPKPAEPKKAAKPAPPGPKAEAAKPAPKRRVV